MTAPVARRFACVLPFVPPTSSGTAAAQFRKAYRRRWGENPLPYAIYAYEAMKLYLDTIGSLGSDGADRTAVTGALHPTAERTSVLGDYQIDLNGDISTNEMGVYRVNARGVPEYASSVAPAVHGRSSRGG
jgi:branched-chain amino acid transport system substrate-binding protein